MAKDTTVNRDGEADDRLAAALRGVAESAAPSTVGIGRRWSRGTGMVVAPGRVVTNAHNVDGPQVGVVFGDGRAEVGTVVAADVDAELAVVEVETADAPALEPGTDQVDLGSTVIAVANPGGRGVHVTAGRVSALGRRFRGPRGRRLVGAIEHTAPLVRGSSGGPLFDRDGRWIGLNTHRLEGGLYLALPVDEALVATIDGLARGQAPRRPRLGIAVAPPDAARRLRSAVGLDERDGLLVRDVAVDGPADRAGIRRGDLVVAVGGSVADDADDLHAVLAAHDVAMPLVVSVVRGVEEFDLEVDLAG